MAENTGSLKDSPSCPICGWHKTEHLCHVMGYEVQRCRHCCSDFVWPLPSAKELKAYYDAPSYFHGEEPGLYTNYDLDTEAVLPLYRELLQEVPGSARRSILDIGCAYGTHLAIAADQGWDAIGVEISDHARQEALARHGNKIAVFSSAEEVPQREFDLITLFDVIEHMPDPYEIFRRLFSRGLIGKHTVVAMTTPNARSSQAVSDPAGWPYRHPPAHLVYYSSHSFKKLWRKMGVLDVEVRGIYPQPEYPPASFPDEASESNVRVSSFAGLLCIASGFASSPALICREVESGMRSAIAAINDEQRAEFQAQIDAWVAYGAQQIRRFGAELLELRESLEFQREEADKAKRLLSMETQKLHAATAEILALKQTKWFQLRAALQARPITASNLFLSARLLGIMALPRSLRPRVKSLVAKVKRPVRRGSAAQIEAYRVRTAPSTGEPAPRVLHVIANFMTGGSSRLVVDLIERLGSQYEQSVLTSFIPTPPAFVGLHISELRSPETEKPFIDHYEKLRPSLIHMHYWGDVDEPWYAKAMKAAEQLGIPVIENINTPVQPYKSGIVQRYVYVSDYVREVFGQPGSSHVTIHPGSDFSHFSRRTGEVNRGDRVGMVYRLERDKLNEESILPFIALVRRRPQTRVLIVGGGELLPVFRKAVASAGVGGNFEFTGYVSYSELPDVYRRISVFVAPVWKESFGQVSAFAMNMEIPVCGYDVGAISEIVEDRSLVAPAGDAEALASIIIRLLDSPEECSAHGKRLRKRAQELFSVEAMVASYSSIYQELVEAAAYS